MEEDWITLGRPNIIDSYGYKKAGTGTRRTNRKEEGRGWGGSEYMEG